MRDKSAIEASEPVAVIKIGEREPVLQGKIGHRRSASPEYGQHVGWVERSETRQRSPKALLSYRSGAPLRKKERTLRGRRRTAAELGASAWPKIRTITTCW